MSKLSESGLPETLVEIDSPDFPVPFESADSTPPVIDTSEVPTVDLLATSVPDSAESAARLTPRMTKQGSPFTPLELQLAMNLRKQGCSNQEIATRLDRSAEGVRQALAKWGSTVELAKTTLQAEAVTLAERVVKDADVDQALEVLDRLDVLPKREKESGGNKVQVILGVDIDQMHVKKFGVVDGIE